MFTQEQKLLHHVVLHANDFPSIGLLDGQMGLILILSEYSRLRKQRSLLTARDFLLDQVLNNLTTATSMDFANGLTGIGWGIEYLLQKKFIRGSSIDICEAIDCKLMQQNICRMNDLGLDKGVEGWLHYIIAHIQGGLIENKQCFDTAYLKDVSNLCKNLIRQEVSSTLYNLCMTFLRVQSGCTDLYNFNLIPFIHSQINKRTKILGIRDGQAGILFTSIIDKLS